ncbi:MAG: tetratricopeptide repeat protein [Pseudomonadota bacterium]
MALSLARISATALAASMMIGWVATVPSYAAGGGTTNTTVTCKKGKVFDRKKKKCVKAKKSSGLSDENLFEAGRNLAYLGRYDEALNVLHLADNKSDPRILNFLGYSTRKLGRIEEGLGYYQAAVKADPDYTLVREYMGEAFLQLGQVDKAREQLNEIANRCGTNCAEYAMLETEINKYVARLN